MEYIQENERTPKKDEGGINLRDVVELIIANWYWFVLSVLVCVGSAYFYVLTIQPVYQRQAVMLVKDKEKSASDMSAMLEVSGGITGTSVDNEIYILRSHQLLREVVNRLHLDVGYAKDGILRDAPLYAESPVEVHFIDPYNQPVSFNITPLNTTKFRISDWKVAGEKGRMQEQDLTYNDTIRTEAGRIVVQLRSENLSAYLSQPISVSRISPEIATNIYQSKIATSLAGERTTLVQITCSDTNISRADAILAALVKVYSETIIEDKNRIAANTAKFIDERISIISRELSDVEEDLTDFKQRNQIVDMSANATQYLAESSKIKEESAQLETELSIARSIKSYLADVTRKDQLIPNVTGVGDVSMQSQITAYNELMLQRNRLKESSGEKNPVVQAADKNLEGMRATISGSMDNYMKTLRLRLDKAKECGIDVCVNTMEKDFGEAMVEAFGPDKADVIYDCAGNDITMGQAIKYARKGSSIILVAVFAGMANIDLAVLNDHELDLNTSMMYRNEDYIEAIRLVNENKVLLKPLISKHFAFKDYKAAYEYIDANRETTMKVIMDIDK